MNEEFEKFWSAYPRKDAKEPARAIWLQLARSGKLPSLPVLLDALEKFKNSAMWQKEHGRFVMFCVKWLKGCRWLDDLGESGNVLTPMEKAQEEKSQAVKAKIREEIEKSRSIQAQETARIRPVFNAFLSKFNNQSKSGPAWGLWHLLYKMGNAPLADNVPENNQTDILLFLKNWQHENVVYS